MRVGLCFFGQPRFLNSLRSFSSHRSALSKYSVDIFVHCWWSRTPADSVASSWSTIKQAPYDRDTIKTIRNLYRPVHAVYEEPREFDVDESLIGRVEFIKSRTDLNNIKSHLYSIKRVGQCLRDYTDPSDYDFIVLSRFDNVIENFPRLEDLPPKFYKMADHPGLADQLFYFAPKYIDFLNVYDRYDELNRMGADHTLEKLKLMHYDTTFVDDPMIKSDFYVTLVRS